LWLSESNSLSLLARSPLLEMGVSLAVWRSQRRSAARPPAQFVKDFIEPIDFHLMDHPEQFAEAAFRKSALFYEPTEILHRQIVQRDAAGRIVIRPVLSKWHPSRADVRKIRRHPLTEPILVHRAAAVTSRR
jgi:hypothetical protein